MSYEHKPPSLEAIDGLSTNPVEWLKQATEREVRQALREILGREVLEYCMQNGYEHPNGIQVVKLGVTEPEGEQAYNLRLHVFGGEPVNPATRIHTHAWGMVSRVLHEAVEDRTYEVDRTTKDGPHQLYAATSPILTGTSVLKKVQTGVESHPAKTEVHDEGSVRHMDEGIYHDASGVGDGQPITLVLNEETGANRTPLVVGTVDIGDRVVVPRRQLDPRILAEGLRIIGLIQ